MMSFLRRFKPAYAIYNFFQKGRLGHIQSTYRKLGINKSYYEPVTHRDFKGKVGESPWLDRLDSREVLPDNEKFRQLPPSLQNQILNWSERGYAILPGFFDERQVEFINAEIEKIVANNQADWKANHTKIMFAVRQSDALRQMVDAPRVRDVLELLLGREVQLFQSINFLEGSQQKTHSDSVHMTTFPLGNLIAIWIALEDIKPGSGVLHYYPGSHTLPYIMTDDFEHGGSRWFLGKEAYPKYEERIAEVIRENNFEKQNFLAKKGDILIWHANLLHGGNPITDSDLSRKSMVLHYYAKGVACYHEITQRPALFE